MPTRDEDFRYGSSEAELSGRFIGVDLAHEGEHTLNTGGVNDICFPNVDLTFREDGRIILRGREIHNDLELVNALRQAFRMPTLAQLEIDQSIQRISERLADHRDREIMAVVDEAAFIEEGDWTKLTDKLEPEEEDEVYIEI